MTTIKQTIEIEAVKAARAVRDALVAFEAATGTGFPVRVEANWVQFQRMDSPHSEALLNSVTLSIGGREFTA